MKKNTLIRILAITVSILMVISILIPLPIYISSAPGSKPVMIPVLVYLTFLLAPRSWSDWISMLLVILPISTYIMFTILPLLSALNKKKAVLTLNTILLAYSLATAFIYKVMFYYTLVTFALLLLNEVVLSICLSKKIDIHLNINLPTKLLLGIVPAILCVSELIIYSIVIF